MTGDSYLVQTGNQLSGYIIINDVSKNGKELVVQEQVTGTVNGALVTITGTGACILKGRSDGAARAEHRRVGYVWSGAGLIHKLTRLDARKSPSTLSCPLWFAHRPRGRERWAAKEARSKFSVPQCLCG